MPKQLDSRTWVIIPGFNEEKYITRVLKKVRKYTKNIIVVDDGSKDRTAFLAAKLTPHVLCHSINLGKGAALKTGAEYAFYVRKAKAVVFMDADDQHRAEELQLFNKKLRAGCQVVFGARELKGSMPLFKKIANSFASYLMVVFFGRYIPDVPSGYKALSKKAYETICWQAEGYEVELEIAARVAMRKMPFEVVKIDTIYHDFGKGMTLLDVINILACFINWRFSL